MPKRTLNEYPAELIDVSEQDIERLANLSTESLVLVWKKSKEICADRGELLQDSLESLSTEELAKLWHQARELVMLRNRKKLLNGNHDKLNYPGSLVSVVDLDLVARSRIHELKSSKERLQYKPLKKIHCDGECRKCPFGVEDAYKKWNCTLPKSRVKIMRPNLQNGKKAK